MCLLNDRLLSIACENYLQLWYSDCSGRNEKNGSISRNLTICPRVVSLKGPGSTIRVPVKVCSLSAKVIEIPPKVVLCSLKSIDVVDTWTPEPEQEHKSSTVVEGLRDQIDRENLSSEQYAKAERLLNNWFDIFLTGQQILGKQIWLNIK